MDKIAVMLVCCVLAACQRTERQPAAATRTDSTAVMPPAPPIPAEGVADEAQRVLLALDGEGLRAVVQSSGSTRLLSFGMPAADVVSIVTAALGSPTTRGTNADCGAGPVEFVAFPDGVSIVIQAGRFVGWSARASSTGRPITTMSGVGVGATRATLDSAYAAKVSRTTLGTEFAAGGISGVLDGAAPSAHITDMWAGTTCVAR